MTTTRVRVSHDVTVQRSTIVEVPVELTTHEAHRRPEYLAKEYVSAACDAGQPIAWADGALKEVKVPTYMLKAEIVPPPDDAVMRAAAEATLEPIDRGGATGL